MKIQRATLPVSLAFLAVTLILISQTSCLVSPLAARRFSRTTPTMTPFQPQGTFTPEPDPAAHLSTGGAGTVPPGSTTAPRVWTTGTLVPEQSVQETSPSEASAASPGASPTEHSPGTSGPGSNPPTNTPVPPTNTSVPAPTEVQDTPKPTATEKVPAPTVTSKPPTATQQSASATPKPSATPASAGCTYTGNAAYEDQVINLINQKRKDRGLSPLKKHASLQRAARRHSQDMACSDNPSHTGTDGSTLGSRLLDAGYTYSWAAENIAYSSSQNFSPGTVVNLWMNSAGHRKNILSEKARHIGVGFRYVGDDQAGDYDAYYTADFGRP